MNKRIAGVVLVVGVMVVVTASAYAGMEAGRYKKAGTTCTWDDKDSGPNQCTPLVEGRFKKDGDACTWASGDRGADQCRPAKGRFKKDGNACAWNGTDTGPDQCNPRQAR
jgi:hypothetical protein